MSDENTTIKISGGSVGINARGATSIITHAPRAPSTSSLEVEGSINARRITERNRYNKWLKGEALRTELGHEIIDGVGSDFSTPPSWVQTHTGRNQAFVINEVTASIENSRNVFLSRSLALESTAVSASGSEFYSKTSTVTTTYKISGSEDLGTTDAVKGTEYKNSGNALVPALSIPIEVSDYGNLVDIKIWFECLTTRIGVPSEKDHRLGNLWVTLESPNVNGFDGWPAGNDIEASDQFSPSRFTNQFLLWIGGTSNVGFGLAGQRRVWNSDVNMRTIFWDSSNQRNPCDVTVYFASGSEVADEHLLGRGSPAQAVTGVAYATGSSISWISDAGIVTGSEAAAGSPPAGWLTAAGGVTGSNEWPTTGSNFGPETIRPYLPILDPLLQEWPLTGLAHEPPLIIGRRPGLRNTEINGVWTLRIYADEVGTGDTTFVRGYFRQARLEITYKKNKDPSIGRMSQHLFSVRNADTFATKRRALIVSGSLSPGEDRPKHVNPDVIVGRTSTIFYDDELTSRSPGLTVGITSNTASNLSDFAVFSRLTGSLSTRLTGSDTTWFLINEYDTPFIPISSGSGEEPTFDIQTDPSENLRILNDAVAPKPLVSRALTLRSIIANKGLTTQSRDIIAAATTGSL